MRQLKSKPCDDKFQARLNLADEKFRVGCFDAAVREYRACLCIADQRHSWARAGIVATECARAALRQAEALLYAGRIRHGIKAAHFALERLRRTSEQLKDPALLGQFTREVDVLAQTEHEITNRPLWILYPDLYEPILHILFTYDPQNVTYPGSNPGAATEYASEVDKILPKVGNVQAREDVRSIVGDVFLESFAARTRPQLLEAIADQIFNCIRQPRLKAQLGKLVDVEVVLEKTCREILGRAHSDGARLNLALQVSLQNKLSELKSEKLLEKVFGSRLQPRDQSPASKC